MSSDSEKYLHDQDTQAQKEPSSSDTQPISLTLFAVQLRNILPIEVVTKRYFENEDIPVASQSQQPRVRLNIEEPKLNIEQQQARVLMEIYAESADEPRLFEISLKLAGLFSYSTDYDLNMIRQFLQFGSLSVMLPYARELLFNLSARLQIPLIMLPLVQLVPPHMTGTETENTPR